MEQPQVQTTALLPSDGAATAAGHHPTANDLLAMADAHGAALGLNSHLAACLFSLVLNYSSSIHLGLRLHHRPNTYDSIIFTNSSSLNCLVPYLSALASLLAPTFAPTTRKCVSLPTELWKVPPKPLIFSAA